MAPTPAAPLVTPPKLVATDLDGTLFRSDGTLSRRTRAALASAEGAGIRVVLVTGRPPRGVPDLLERVGPHTVIAANGAAVHSPDGTVAHIFPLPAAEATRLVEHVRAAIPGVSFAVEFDGAFGHEPAYPAWSFGDEAVELIGTAEEILAPGSGRPPLKILAHHPELPLDAFYERARHAAGPDAETTHSTGLSLVEFSAPGVTKATTLVTWSGRLGIGAHEIAAFGDMPNDLPLLGAVGSSYAMANAHPDVLAAARHRAPSNDEDGVAQVLEGFVDTVTRRASLSG
ncbi:putative hydrolase [Streptomyces hygroscopicus subsp. jinggangensis 5008]|nr:putative hydrolase [Streptomyces hygroscopicus subsp. jinggangensis 5008]AGF61809.1 putative hydrolase [Streptomyces hygroscopicus subsp. jinggangensis TL01]